MQSLLSLSGFSSVIELATTLNIAFVAIEYVKTYTKVLCNQVFDLKQFIQRAFQECVSGLPDSGTLATIPHITINEHNTDEFVEKLKRDCELLLKEINNTKELHEEKVDEVCEAKNVSSISLFLFFVGVGGLILSGFEADYQSIVRCLWSIFFICSLIYCIIGWGVSEESKHRVFNFESLRHAIISFFVVLVISSSIFIWHQIADIFIQRVWNWLLPVSVLFSFSNFVIASGKIWYKARDTKVEIKKSQEEIIKKCQDLSSKVNQMISVRDLANDLYKTD